MQLRWLIEPTDNLASLQLVTAAVSWCSMVTSCSDVVKACSSCFEPGRWQLGTAAVLTW